MTEHDPSRKCDSRSILVPKAILDDHAFDMSKITAEGMLALKAILDREYKLPDYNPNQANA